MVELFLHKGTFSVDDKKHMVFCKNFTDFENILNEYPNYNDAVFDKDGFFITYKNMTSVLHTDDTKIDDT